MSNSPGGDRFEESARVGDLDSRDETVTEHSVSLLVRRPLLRQDVRQTSDVTADDTPTKGRHVVTVSDVFADDIVDTLDVARILGTTSRSVTRWRSGDAAPRRENEERLLELDAVLDLVRQVFPSGSARRWMRTPVPALDYDKPLDLIARGEWRRVVDVLLATAEGVTA